MNCTCKEPHSFYEFTLANKEMIEMCMDCGKPISTSTVGYVDSRTLEEREADSKFETTMAVSTSTEGSMEERLFQDNTGEKVSGWLAVRTDILNKGDYKIATPEDIKEIITQEKERSVQETVDYIREKYHAARLETFSGESEVHDFIDDLLLEAARSPKP